VIIKQINWLKTSYVAILRFAFGSDTTPVEYKYNRDVKLNKISIYRGFPRRVELYPAIIIESDASNANMTFLGEEQLQENRDVSGNLISVTYGGSLTVPIKLTIQARTITDMERLTDICMVYVRYLFRNKFAEYGFAYTHIGIGADSQDEIDGEPIFSKTITVDNYTEFQNTIDGALFTDIKKINLNVLVEGIELES